MRIKISDLGPIHDEAQFELKPLTIFIGPNNSGKTWLAYTLAAVFGEFGIGEFTAENNITSILNTYPPIAKAVETLLTTGLASLNIYQFAATYTERYLADVIACVREKLSNFMATSLPSINNIEMSIELNDTRTIFMQHIVDSAFESGTVYSNPNTAFSAKKQKGQQQVDIYITVKDQVHTQLPHDITQKHVAWYVFSTLHHALFSNVTVQPTERTIISLPLPVRISAEMQKKFLSWPVGRYISLMADILALGSAHKVSRKQEAKDNPQIQRYVDLAQLLEERILNGKVYLSTPEPAPSREVLFHPNDCPSPLEISLASSMVKELALLVFYLRSFAQPNELLIIDEPEMDLHPKVQVQVLELLTMLVDAGINVLITTHSPYMIDHLGNLTKAFQHSKKERIQQEFYLQDSGAFIDENKVSMYFIGKGIIQDTLHDEELDWDTFGDVSNRLNEIYFSL